MKPRRLVMLAGMVLVLLGVAAVFITRYSSLATPHHMEQATYYCPMHPTYTSDRPGDCPICNMRLVKQAVSRQPSAVSRGQTKAQQDICYLHNCPMVREGKPCPMLVVAKEGEEVTCPVCGTHVTEGGSTGRKILYWTDPMIPGYQSDKPGKSPMGMELVPVYETAGAAMATGMEPAGYAPVLLTPQKQQLIGVTTAPVRRQALTKTIRAAGRIAYDPALYQAEAEYLQALGAFLQAQTAQQPEVRAQAEQLVHAGRTRLQVLGVSPELIQEMTGWRGPDQRLLLADPNGEVWVYASIYEFELPLVEVGQTLTVIVPSLPGESFQGAIRSIDPVLDPATRAARVRAVLTDVERRLKPEMFVDVSIAVARDAMLAVPEEAVFHTGIATLVFVDKGEGLFEPRDVVTGLKADGMVEVTRGLAEGERAVTSGNFLIDSESRLKAALEGMGSGTPTTTEGAGESPREGSGGHQHGGQ